MDTPKRLIMNKISAGKSILSIIPTEEQKLKDKLPAHLWYKFFYKKPTELNFNSVNLPKVNRTFK